MGAGLLDYHLKKFEKLKLVKGGGWERRYLVIVFKTVNGLEVTGYVGASS